MDKYFKAIDRNKWKRNPQWLTFPEDDGLDDKSYFLVAIFEDAANIISINQLNITDVDWGDGNIETGLASIISHTYDYSTISGPVLTYDDGRNYKQVVIELISDQSIGRCQLLMDDLNSADNNILDADFRFAGAPNQGPNDPFSYTFRFGSSTKDCYYLERVKAKYPINGVGFTRAFQNCIRLSELDVPSDMFDYCSAGNQRWFDRSGTLSRVPLVFPNINNSEVTTQTAIGQQSSKAIFGDITFNSTDAMVSSFIHSNLLKIGNLTMTACITTRFMFGGTVGSSLIDGIGLIDTPLVEDISDMFQSCKMPVVEWTDCSNVTTTTDVFNGTGNIEKVIMPGLTVGVDVSYNKLTATAIDAFFTSVGTANGTQTLNVSNNPGSATCDTTIATNKGWTVIT